MNLTLLKSRPFRSANGGVVRLRDEMDRTLGRFFGDPFGSMEVSRGWEENYFPQLDVTENDTEVVVRAELPGVALKDMNISISGKTLTIAGHKEEKEENKGKDFYQSECRYGSFCRVLELSDATDSEQVTAESENGVVTVHVPKKASARTKQIEVKPIEVRPTSKKLMVSQA